MRNPVGVFERKAGGWVSGRRMANQCGPLQAERIHETQDEFLAIGAAQILRRIGLAEARQVERDGANTLFAQGSDIATEHICRGTERTAMQHDGRHATTFSESAFCEGAFYEGAFYEGAFFEIARVETVDCNEAIIGFDNDIHW